MSQLDTRRLSPDAQEQIRVRGGDGDPRRHDQVGDGARLRRVANLDRRLAAKGLAGKHHLAAVEETRPTAADTVAVSSGRHDRQADHRSHARSAQAALRALDARGGARSHRAAYRLGGLGANRRPLSEALGLHPAEAAAPRLRARPGGGGALEARGSTRRSRSRPRPKTPRFIGAINSARGAIIRPAAATVDAA